MSYKIIFQAFIIKLEKYVLSFLFFFFNRTELIVIGLAMAIEV